MARLVRFIIPSWDEVCNLATSLAEQIRGRFAPDVIVGVARGGLIPARLMSDFLNVSTLLTVGVAFYADIDKRGKEPRITQALPSHITGKNLLVVDDVADTGRSLEVVVAELRKHQLDIRTATLYRKPWVEFKPDFYAKETDAWIVFPWERRETVRKIAGRVAGAGKNFQEVEDQLVSAGMKRPLAHDLVKAIAREVSQL